MRTNQEGYSRKKGILFGVGQFSDAIAAQMFSIYIFTFYYTIIGLDINLITIALAAQKNNVNPLVLMSQLTKSYYNKWNGVAEKPLGYEDKNTLVPISSLIKSYNWDEIREKNAGKDGSLPTIDDAIIIEDAEVEEVEDKKERLLKAIRESSKTKI